MYYYLNDCSDRLVELSEQVHGNESEFMMWLYDNGVSDTRNVSREQWKELERRLQVEFDNIDTEEED